MNCIDCFYHITGSGPPVNGRQHLESGRVKVDNQIGDSNIE